MRCFALFLPIALAASPCVAREKKPARSSLADYMARVQTSSAPAPPTSAGSLWSDAAPLTDLASDHKARAVGDLIAIEIVEQTVAEANAGVATERNFAATSGVSALAGRVPSHLDPLVSPHSSEKLSGKGQAASQSRLRTTLAARVVAVLNSGGLVVEAERDVLVNNERQTVRVRGVARPADVSPDNTVLSTQLSNLEIELQGRGVVSEGTRPPHILTRWLLRLLGF